MCIRDSRQAAHCPLDIPKETLFTKEQLENLALITSESLARLEFAKIVYFMDITVRRVKRSSRWSPFFVVLFADK